MLIPQFSIRWLLALTTVCALVLSIVSLAVQGHAWAAGVSIGIGALMVSALVYGAIFALVWLFSVVTAPLTNRWGRMDTSPFMADASGRSLAMVDREVPATPILLESAPATPEEA